MTLGDEPLVAVIKGACKWSFTGLEAIRRVELDTYMVSSRSYFLQFEK